MNLVDTQKKLYELRDINSELDKLQYAKKHPLYDVGDSLLEWLRRIFIGGTIAFFIYELIVQIHDHTNGYQQSWISKLFSSLGAIITSVIYALIIVILLLAVYYFIKLIIFIINVIRNHTNRAKLSKENFIEEEKEMLNKKKLIVNELNTSEVPFHYRNTNAVNWMIDAYNNKRGNTYTELINLYERHLSEENNQKTINDLIAENQRLQSLLKNPNKF